jgi:hypothetical protein
MTPSDEEIDYDKNAFDAALLKVKEIELNANKKSEEKSIIQAYYD